MRGDGRVNVGEAAGCGEKKNKGGQSWAIGDAWHISGDIMD